MNEWWFVSGFQCKVILLLLGCDSVECRGLLMNGSATLFHFLLCSRTNYGVPDGGKKVINGKGIEMLTDVLLLMLVLVLLLDPNESGPRY
jgi:hypothetical protein